MGQHSNVVHDCISAMASPAAARRTNGIWYYSPNLKLRHVKPKNGTRTTGDIR